MFKKGRRREAKGLAVVYFIIGLIILLIILAVIYFALVELDYSDRIKDPEATIRAYVEMTAVPETLAGDADFEEELAALDVDLTAPTDTPEPTPTPTPEPTPTPTPVPTPEPTPFPQTLMAQPVTSGFTLPSNSATNCEAAITKCAVSVADDSKRLYLAGYGYIDDAAFDGAQAKTFLIVNQTTTNQKIAYQMTMTDGASGVAHDGAQCQNASACDYEVYIDVGDIYKDDIYTLGLVIGYKTASQKNAVYAYYPFSSDVAFTVVDGKVVTPVSVPGGETAAVAGAVDDPDFDDDFGDVDDFDDLDDLDGFDDFDDFGDDFDDDGDDSIVDQMLSDSNGIG